MIENDNCRPWPQDQGEKSFKVRYLKVTQPIGDFYIASMKSKDLIEITDFDVRRVLIEERDVEKYLGIQRPLNQARVKEIKEYVKTKDACFPTAVIIAVPARCIEIVEDKCEMTISNYINNEEIYENVNYRNIARVLDGQHRLAGLVDFAGEFEINVCIFVDADIADQAIIFSTVNLTQTKVNKSLAYDLFDLMKTRSPQKTCHNIAITLDAERASPFYKMIKRLGVATPGRGAGETLTQATFIEPILQAITDNPMRDRDLYLKNMLPKKLPSEKLNKHPFQHLFVEGKDYDITDIIWNFFSAVKDKWPNTWESRERGVMINRTNGYRALMRYLIHLFNTKFKKDYVPTVDEFIDVLKSVSIDEKDITAETFPPGTSGESKFYKALLDGGLS